MFLTHVHRLRGLAILLIVLEHCVDFLRWNEHLYLLNTFNDLLENSTILFVFIAGYLFHHLTKTFDYRTYLYKKFKNVLIPYLFMAAPAVFYAIAEPNLAIPLSDLEGQSLFFKISWFYLYPGSTLNFALWYIPVITLLFLVAPLFFQMIKHPILYITLVLLIPISLLAHRPTYSMHHNVQLFIYFLSAYVVGMLFSQFRAQTEKLYDQYLYLFAGAYFAILLGHHFLASHHGYYQVRQIFDFTHGIIDWIYLQQLVLAIFLLGFLRLFNNIKMPILNYLGDISFTIFFTHLYVIYIIKWFLQFKHPEFSPAIMLAVFGITIITTSAFAFVVKKLFKSRSRMLIGS